ncbi:hypothetical protein X772_23820 [Mesorhizobium sp. LSJC280B00]|nr:hypothetical protein X772_23820 [Mesorhizobium sp. LSJC280B00]
MPGRAWIGARHVTAPGLARLRSAFRILQECGRSFDERMLIQSEALRQKR